MVDTDVTYRKIREHIGHQIVVVGYAHEPAGFRNVAVECETCSCVIVDADRPTPHPKIPIPDLSANMSGFVRLQADGKWAWKCEACSTADHPFDTYDEAVEELVEHYRACFECR